MDYRHFARRGSKAMEQAADIWYKRFNKLLKVWHESQGAKKARLWRITCELDDRGKALRELYWAINREQKARELEGQHEIIKLECPNFECRYGPDGLIYTGYLKDYKEGERKCEVCGESLRLVEDQYIDHTLYQLGVTLSK